MSQITLVTGNPHKLAGEGRVQIVCTMGYYDGTTEHIVDGVLDGKVVAPRDGEGFGFDFVIIPDGYSKTMSELGMNTKNSIGHRARAAQQMVTFLESIR